TARTRILFVLILNILVPPVRSVPQSTQETGSSLQAASHLLRAGLPSQPKEKRVQSYSTGVRIPTQIIGSSSRVSRSDFMAWREKLRVFYVRERRRREIRPSTSVSNEEVRRGDIVPPVEKRRIKLPETPLPRFDGRFEGWLSFKNAFYSMIGSRTDLAEIDKLHYLRAALTGEAANKIRIFEIDGINYAKAWSLLERSYEVKRILISRHLSLLLNLPALDKETTNGLSRLADDAQQHVASLNSLGISVGHEMIVHLLETKLPRITLEKWEATLERDEFPELDQMYEFLYKTAVCVSKRERAKVTDMEGSRGEPSSKKRRSHPSNQAFVVSAARNCIACKTKRHPLYLCDKFKQLPIPKRIETVRNAKVCYNCFRSHRDSPCKFSNCTICQKKHNTLLHLDKHPVTNRTSTSNTVDTQTA
ncbi:PREDICTED: uncharacterized protein LOC105556474, partial [Vollenhovia emeryi]|uniref:uncharacterized protein LOC105556474 n=1 Tax=Vollenhovia emeryi TaxID=411798 RepID=UPI0005F46BC0